MLLYISQNSRGIVFQLHGNDPEHFRTAAVGFLIGVLLFSPLLPTIERYLGMTGTRGAWIRGLFLVLLVLPIVYVAARAAYGDVFGARADTLLMPLSWSISTPPALWVFFRGVPQRRWGLMSGLSLAGGYLCCALLVPLVNTTNPALFTSPTALRYLSFLNVASLFFALITALVIWIAFIGCAKAAHLRRRPSAPEIAVPEIRRLPWLLLSVGLCFFIAGALRFVFFVRVETSSFAYPEYMHLGLAVSVPLLGYWVDKNGDRGLKAIIMCFVGVFSISPLILMADPASLLYKGVLIACSVAIQGLCFSIALVCARFIHTRKAWCGVLLCMQLLMMFFAFGGGVFGLKIMPLLTASPVETISLLAFAAMLAAVFAVKEAFPLPSANCSAMSGEEERPPPAINQSFPAQLDRFAKVYKLTKREIEVLENIAGGKSTEQIAKILNLRINSVRTYAQHLLQKTGTQSRLELLSILSRRKAD